MRMEEVIPTINGKVYVSLHCVCGHLSCIIPGMHRRLNAAGHPFCALPRGILRGNGHMWAPPLYHFVWDFSLFYEYTLILKGGATSLELVYYISVVYFANLCTS